MRLPLATHTYRVLVLLVAYGSSAYAEENPGARLLDAAARGELQNVRAAIAAGAPVDTRDESGRTALLIALQGSASEYRVIGANEPIARFLVERGADAAERIGVKQQHAAAGQRSCGGQIHRRRGFTHAAFLIRNCDDFGHVSRETSGMWPHVPRGTINADFSVSPR